MESEVIVTVVEASGNRQEVTAPTDLGLNLMEVLKAHDFPVLGTCGGMALCATCHVEVLEGPVIQVPSDDEAYMLETLPFSTPGSRLSCQIRISPAIDGLVIRLAAFE
jgi:ferredoxin, 2Fe-2S